MFNAMTPAALTTLLAGLLAESAGWDRPLDEFQVGQLKSASSIGRHLAAELAGGPAVRAAFAGGLARVLDEEPGPPELTSARAVVAAALGDGDDPATLGGPVADLLATGRAYPDADALGQQVRRLLRELADAEIAVLSGPPSTLTT